MMSNASPENSAYGVIRALDHYRGTGTIQATDGVSFEFHFSSTGGSTWDLSVGDECKFTLFHTGDHEFPVREVLVVNPKNTSKPAKSSLESDAFNSSLLIELDEQN